MLRMPFVRSRRRSTLVAIASLAIVSTIPLPGCFLFGARVREFQPVERAYTGPAITLGERDGRHLATLEAPSTAYSFELEGRRGAVDGSVVFLTVRRPDPRFMYTQQIVEQQLLTPARATETIRVYARVVDHDDTSNELPFAFVGERTGNTSAGLNRSENRPATPPAFQP
jgi:hypothetical protein